MPALRNCSRTVMDRTLASSSRTSDSRFSGRSTYAASTGRASGPGYGPRRGQSAVRVSWKEEDEHQAGWRKSAEQCGLPEEPDRFYRDKLQTAQPVKRPPLADIEIDVEKDRTPRQGVIGAYPDGPALAVRGAERDEAAGLEVMQQNQTTYQPRAGVQDSQRNAEVEPYARVGHQSAFQDGAIRGRTIYSSHLEPPFTYNATAQTHRGYYYASRDAVEETSTHSATHPVNNAIAFLATYGAGLAGNPSYEQPDNYLVPTQDELPTYDKDDTSFKMPEAEGMGSAALGVPMSPQEERARPDAYRHSREADSSAANINTPDAMDRIADSLFDDRYLSEDHRICWLDQWISAEIMRQLTPSPTGFDQLEDEAANMRDYEDEEEDASDDDNGMLYVIEEGDGVDFANDGGEDNVE